ALFSDAGNSWTEALQDVRGTPGLSDAGDLILSEGPEARAEIERAIAALLAEGYSPLALGGDHSISYPILCALGRRHPGLTVLQLDAHPDLYDEFQGDRFSHACPFARVM